MNIENFKLLRDHVAQNAKFNMDTAFHSCGSAACIMGSAEALIMTNNHRLDLSNALYIDDLQRLRVDTYYVRRWLDISMDEYLHLYLGEFSSFREHIETITQEEAVDFLDKCIQEGYICLHRP